MSTASTMPNDHNRFLFCGRCSCSTLRTHAESESTDDSLRCGVCQAHLGYRKRPPGTFGGTDRKRVASGEAG